MALEIEGATLALIVNESRQYFSPDSWSSLEASYSFLNGRKCGKSLSFWHCFKYSTIGDLPMSALVAACCGVCRIVDDA